MARARVRMLVRGLVQGVYFRQSTADEGERLGLSGTARNLPGGEVEVQAEGEREAVEALVRWCHRGPPAARVEAVEVAWEPPTGESGGFRVAR
ncbi:acylphosphatase [Anaeromyxobacter paludicola]|uniref:acylphosphatase n=1 Tax=Anaeromyxobacter paludicola TaxID=2918171 RepID=A0ABN6NAD6_9BACT|nr:acylphosphatase [Anaeromyxobacter paludicola]BDG08970.1 acylphosphatase [Anaeromyxobacter paludicola]